MTIQPVLECRPMSALIAAAAVAVGIMGVAQGAYPSPVNDSPGTAVAITAVPAVVTGSNVNGDDTITATTLAGLTSVPGADVFYSFTPATTGSYWVVMIPWVEVPVYASSGASVPLPNLCVYLRNASSGVFVAGSDANGRDVPDAVVATLTAGTPYEIVVDSVETVLRGQQFEFTLVVAAAPAVVADDCLDGAVISGPLPTAVVGTLTGAVDDFTFVEGTGRSDVAITPTIPGADHVWEFTTGASPSDAGDYVFNLMPGGSGWDGYVYIADSCPPFFPLGCLGAANHTNNTLRQAEAVVVTLDYDTTYYVFVEANSYVLTDAKYTLVVDRADGYDIREMEPNDTDLDATPLAAGVPNGGQIVGAADTDYWAIDAVGGEKLYAFLDNGNATLSGIDSELRLYNTDGITLLELDDDDGDISESPVPTLVHRSSSFSATIAGAPLYGAGTYFLQADSYGTATLARYRMHYGLEPAGRDPAPECEPNNDAGLADGSAKAYYAGVIDPQGDVDRYTFDALAGDRVYLALDGDPERDSGGDDPNDPLALDAALRVWDPDGDLLITDHDDVNAVDLAQTPDYPAEAVVFVAPLTGTYHVEVSGGQAADYGAGRTYELAIFKDDAAPSLTEDVDPVIDSMVPNVQTDTIAVTASDDAAGDSGLCAVGLAPGSVNLTITGLALTPGDPTVSFTIALVKPNDSGSGKLIITDCAGNTACAAVDIDASGPTCGGTVTESGYRVLHSTHPPLHAPDNQPSGPGVNGEIVVLEAGTVSDVNVTITVESSRVADVDVYLESPTGTRVDVVTDRGSSSAFDIIDATFDDAGTEMMSLLSSDEPYTGVWLPDDAAGLAAFNGAAAQGTWLLNVIDDSSSSSGGSRLVRWTLEIDAGFPNPEVFEGTASDTGGLQSLVLVGGDNVQLNVPPEFVPGDLSVAFTVTLIDTSKDGSGTVVVTDVSENTCEVPVALVGLPDLTPPANAGSASRDLVFGAEVQQSLPGAIPGGVVSTVNVPSAVVVGEVEVGLTINTLDIGRLVSTLEHGTEFAALINRVGMTERGSVGLTKDNLELTLDDDAPVADDAHLEPALGTIEFWGLHQPDGRGEFIGDGISTDDRDNMLFALEGLNSSGAWQLYAADFRVQGASAARSIFRRWEATVRSPGAPERYVGKVRDLEPQAGICSIALAAGATNLTVAHEFNPLQHEVDYVVTLVDPAQPGSGTLEIEDCAGNLTQVPISLAAALADQSLPVVGGALNPATFEFEGTATDNQPGDSGIAAVELAPYSTNLQLVSVTPDPPAGAASVDFVVGLVDPLANGRGYVRVTDATGYRRHVLVAIDAVGPACTGSVGHSKRYVSGAELPAEIPDNSLAGASSTIVVPDPDLITDLNLTLNITHPMDMDIDLTLTDPFLVTLFTDIGSTGNDFIDTTLDDDADIVIPNSASEAPFTGSYQPEPPASMAVFEGSPAVGTYTLKAVDDAVYNIGTFDSWSLTIEAVTFPERYDGRAQDKGTFDTGICTIELLAGAANVDLDADTFAPGAKIVRYSVTLVNEALDGSATVRVTDCAGNTCDVPVCLTAMMPPAMMGDLNGSGDVDAADLALFAPCMDGPNSGGSLPPCHPCRLADFDLDGDVDLADSAQLQLVVGVGS